MADPTHTETIAAIVDGVIAERPSWSVEYLDNSSAGFVSSVTFHRGMRGRAFQITRADVEAAPDRDAFAAARIAAMVAALDDEPE